MSFEAPVLRLGFRVFYAAAALLAAAGMLAWLLSYTGHLATGDYLVGTFWHSHEMVFGFAAAVLAGFLLTAVRNWTGLPTPTGNALAGMAALWLAARMLLVTGPAPLAALLDVLFLPVLAVAVGRPILQSRNQRNYKVLYLLVAMSLVHVLFHGALLGHLPAWSARTSVLAAIDLFMILLAVVGGRVIPAFTRNAVPGSNPRHETWVEYAAFSSLLLVFALNLTSGWLAWPGMLATLLFIVTAVAHAFRLALWQPQVTVANPLLWMMPVAYSWLPLAFVLRALATAGLIVPGMWIHALTVGAISSLMVAMMMRSSLGHTGRPLVATRLDMLAFLALQLAAIVRVLASLTGQYGIVVIASGLFWVVAFGTFLLRYLPMLLQARIDGRPG